MNKIKRLYNMYFFYYLKKKNNINVQITYDWLRHIDTTHILCMLSSSK